MYKKSWILLGALILLVLSIGLFYTNNNNSQIEGQVIQVDEIIPESETIPEPETEQISPPEQKPELKEFDIIAKRFEFMPETINVNQGDKIRLTITSTDVTHGFLISEYGINEKLELGKPKIIEFTTNKKGEFPIICSVVCGSGHKEMRGELVVS